MMWFFDSPIACTKRDNIERFRPAVRDEEFANRIMFPRQMDFPGKSELVVKCFRSKSIHSFRFHYPSFYCRIVFLSEDKGLRDQLSLIGKRHYNPVLDIDRYCVECGAYYREGGVCPVFEKLVAVLGEQNAIAGDKPDVLDDNGRPFVCDGDGRVGPIAPTAREYDFDFLPQVGELEAICKNCKYRCDEAGNRADERIVLEEINGRRVDAGNVHGKGIIAFFGRLFGRKTRREGK